MPYMKNLFKIQTLLPYNSLRTYHTLRRITGPCYRWVWMCIAGVWDLQTTSFEIPWFLGYYIWFSFKEKKVSKQTKPPFPKDLGPSPMEGFFWTCMTQGCFWVLKNDASDLRVQWILRASKKGCPHSAHILKGGYQKRQHQMIYPWHCGC